MLSRLLQSLEAIPQNCISRKQFGLCPGSLYLDLYCRYLKRAFVSIILPPVLPLKYSNHFKLVAFDTLPALAIFPPIQIQYPVKLSVVE